jgi:GntR family transcriptional regulator
MGDGLIDILPSLNESSGIGGPLYVKLQRLIENAVREGKLLPGDALPPERELAAMAEISRVTVRKAVQGLVNDGLLVQRHGSGTFV